MGLIWQHQQLRCNLAMKAWGCAVQVAPMLPQVVAQMLPDVVGMLMSRIAARALREVYLVPAV